MSVANGNGWWKYTATAAVSALMTIGGFWFGGGNTFAPRAEVREMIQRESPFTQQKAAIDQRMSTTERDVSRIDSKLEKLAEGQQLLLREFSSLRQEVIKTAKQ